MSGTKLRVAVSKLPCARSECHMIEIILCSSPRKFTEGTCTSTGLHMYMVGAIYSNYVKSSRTLNIKRFLTC